MKNDTWNLKEIPQDRQIISCKWVFKKKRDAERKVIRYKARLVARGFSQKYRIDYDEIFVPAVRQSTFRTLLAVAGHKKTHCQAL